jgi:hypothetical protein
MAAPTPAKKGKPWMALNWSDLCITLIYHAKLVKNNPYKMYNCSRSWSRSHFSRVTPAPTQKGRLQVAPKMVSFVSYVDLT